MRIVIWLFGYACGLATVLAAALVFAPTEQQSVTPQVRADEKIGTAAPSATIDLAPTKEPPVSPPPTPIPAKNAWVVGKELDPIDDGERIVAVLLDDTGKAKIELGCKKSKDGKNFLLAFVTLPGFYMSGPGANVVYRINSEPPIDSERWGKFPGSTNTMWILEPYPFLRRLKDNDTLFIRARDLAADTRMQEARFNLANYSTTLTALTSNCPEPAPATTPPPSQKTKTK